MPSRRSQNPREVSSAVSRCLLAGLIWLIGSLLATQSVTSWLSIEVLANQFFSNATWEAWVRWLTSKTVLGQSPEAQVRYWQVFPLIAGVHFACWAIGATWLCWHRGERWFDLFCRWGMVGGVWWGLLGLWDWISLGFELSRSEWLIGFWSVIPGFWCAICLAGWGTTFLTLSVAKPQAISREGGNPVPATLNPRPATCHLQLWGLIAVYVAVFVTMNWRMYFNLLIPHGDSAMYEEHLWNLIHGKGFRSYLDQGLFLGEHIQVVHLGLLPIYVLWPSHLLMEFCESLALALGAWPVYWMIRRQTDSHRAGLAAAAAYLLYSPMQFLDIEIDLKTFRPEAFGIPLLLITLDQIDRRHLKGTFLGVVACLTVKEDYTLVLGPLGLWMFLTEVMQRKADSDRKISRRWMATGVLLMIGSVLYLYVATRIVMPWFRSGGEIHYASYFSKFGESPEEILRTMVTNPGLLLGEFFRISTMLYALMLLLPVAMVPLLSPGRLAVGMPLFGILCLNELARDPRHQFHAPLVAIVFWSLAHGWPRAQSWTLRVLKNEALTKIALPHLVWTSSLAMGLFFSLNPLSLAFWDAGGNWYWRTIYGPSRRAVEFAKIADLVPQSARVASTDFVHPRYTHCERSYDYSEYRRKVSGYEARVPEDTDYIVIDTQHRYSKVKDPGDVPEYRDHSDEWELLPDQTEGYFIVLKRRASSK